MTGRGATIAMLGILLGSLPAEADPVVQPDAALIAKIEKLVHIPKERGHKRVPVDEFARYYTGAQMWGRPVIAGAYLLSGPPGIHIVRPNQMPMTIHGGCGVVRVIYDVKAAQASASCNQP